MNEPTGMRVRCSQLFSLLSMLLVIDDDISAERLQRYFCVLSVIAMKHAGLD